MKELKKYSQAMLNRIKKRRGRGKVQKQSRKKNRGKT